MLITIIIPAWLNNMGLTPKISTVEKGTKWVEAISALLKVYLVSLSLKNYLCCISIYVDLTKDCYSQSKILGKGD